VGVDGGITSSARQVPVLPIMDVGMGPWVTVLLCQTEVDNIDQISSLANTHEEVIGLYIAMDNCLSVDVCDTGYELIRRRIIVFRENLRWQKLKRSSKLGPSKSRTIAL
jgi:hypothetical protein